MNMENHPTDRNVWLFYQAIFSHDKKTVSEMLDRGAIDSIPEGDFMHVCKELIALRDKQIVSYVAQKIDFENEEMCAELFEAACSNNCPSLVREFVQRGAAVNRYPLIAVAADDTFRLITQLPEKYLTDDFKTECFAEAALDTDSHRMIGRLLALGWDVHVRNSEGRDASQILEERIRSASYSKNKSGSIRRREDLRMVRILAKGEFPVEEIPKELKASSKKPLPKGVIVFFAVVFVCIIGGLVAYLAVRGTDTAEETVAEETTVDTETVLFSVDSGDISALSWEYGDESIKLEKNDGIWTMSGDETFPLDTTIPESIAETVCLISGTPVADETGTDYGFDDPEVSASVTSSESEISLVFGYEDTDGVYTQIDGAIYLTDSSIASAFKYCRNDLVLKEEIPEITDPTSLYVANDIEEFTAEYVENSDYTYTNEYKWFISDGDTHIALDTSSVEVMISSLTSIEWSGVAAVNVGDLSEYGLKTPVASLKVEYGDGETFAVDMGIGEDDSYYARLDGSSIIYSISSKFFNNLIYCSSTDLVATDVFLMDFDTVTSIDVVIYGSSMTYEHTLREVVAETTEAEETDAEEAETEETEADEVETEAAVTYESVWTLEGTEVEAGDVFQRLTNLVNKGDASAYPVDYDADIQFIIHTESGTYPTVTLAFYTVSGNNCATRLNGDITYLVLREKIYSIIEDLQIFAE